jgi:hypothetical protein
MTASELRIGSMVYDTMGKVNMVDIDAFKYILSYGETPMCQVKPIPLTDEILRDWCGFSVNEDGFPCAEFAKSDKGYSLSSFDISSRDGMFFLWVPTEDQWYSSELTEIKYLHQLQNLYFAITGEELTINIQKQ